MNRQKGQIVLSAMLWVFAVVSCTMALIAWSHSSSSSIELRLTVQARERLLNTPLFETTAVTLPAELVARARAAGIQQMAVEPIGTSDAAYFVVVNGKTVDNSYSTVHRAEQMYRVDLSGATPRVWVTESIKQSWEPSLVGFVLEREMQEFLQRQAAQEQLKKDWSQPRTT